MMQTSDAEREASDRLLGQVGEALGAPVAPPWVAAFRETPRTAFLPDRVWVGDGLEEISRRADPKAWLEAAYADEPVVTQVNDGRAVDAGEELWPSCSASAPSIVFRMLGLLDVQDGQRICEVGTGTGWNAALLARRVGADRVTTIEVDPVLSEEARVRLARAGVAPRVMCGDGAEGDAAGAPYDRWESTCSVREVPSAWLEQTRPGGVIVTPWDSAWFTYGLLRLVVGEDGGAVGRFLPYSAFMGRREERTDLRIYRDVVRDEHVPAESRTDLSPWSVAGDGEWDIRFTLGLLLPDLWSAWHHDPDVDGVQVRLWVASIDAASWAAVDWDGTSDDVFTVWQHGAGGRRVWDEIETAYRWWVSQGNPGPGRFGMSLAAGGVRTVWLDRPDNPIPAF
ncbi:protein-L-isoaspartate O-methyltransferase [Streptomyces sp. PsTaAH-130]|nr:protein-L-isoaspartate O-methyltransferase [Streptomyces sp. PsTaAH-130]